MLYEGVVCVAMATARPVAAAGRLNHVDAARVRSKKDLFTPTRRRHSSNDLRSPVRTRKTYLDREKERKKPFRDEMIMAT